MKFLPTSRPVQIAVTFLVMGFCPAAAGDFSELEGAWVEIGSPCNAVFIRNSKGLAFQKPINPFLPALLISKSAIQGPASNCRIINRQMKGERHILALSCTTSVASANTKLVLERDGDRLNQYPMASDKIGQGYDRCPP